MPIIARVFRSLASDTADVETGILQTRLIALWASCRRYPIVKDNRPVNLDIGSMRLPITAWASITHRATGVFLFAGVAVLLWALDASLAGPESFASLQETLADPAAQAGALGRRLGPDLPHPGRHQAPGHGFRHR